jgi:SAM-dependent methyltransferase
MPEDVFERFSAEYDAWFDEHPDEYRAELARIQRALHPIDSTTMEIGAGSGRFAVPLGIVLGIEPSRALGRMAHRRGIEIIRGRAEALPIRDGFCSSVLLVTVICFLNDPIPALGEIHRVLVPGGTLVIAFIEREGHVAKKYLHGEGKGRFLSRARFYSPEEVLKFLKEEEFHVDEVDSRAGFCVISARKDRK